MTPATVAEGILIAVAVILLAAFLVALFSRALFIYKVSGFGFIGWLMRLIGRDS